MREPTSELIQRYLPEVSDQRATKGGHWSGVDWRRAERLIGFSAQHGWRERLTE